MSQVKRVPVSLARRYGLTDDSDDVMKALTADDSGQVDIPCWRHAIINFPHPLHENDTIRCTTEVLGKRESKSRPGAGVVDLHHRAYNQHGKLVAECKRQAFMHMRPL